MFIKTRKTNNYVEDKRSTCHSCIHHASTVAIWTSHVKPIMGQIHQKLRGSTVCHICNVCMLMWLMEKSMSFPSMHSKIHIGYYNES